MFNILVAASLYLNALGMLIFGVLIFSSDDTRMIKLLKLSYSIAHFGMCIYLYYELPWVLLIYTYLTFMYIKTCLI